MSVSLRSKSSLTYASHTDPNLTAPAGVQAGDVLFMGAVTFNTAGTAVTPTPPAGWVAIPGATSGMIGDMPLFGGHSTWDMRIWGWTKVSAGSEPATYSIAQAAGSSAYWIGAYTGVDNTTPVPSGFTTNSGTGTTSTALGVTPTVNGSEIIIVAGDGGDTSNNLSIAGTTPTFTAEVPTPVVACVFDGTLATAAATGDKTWTNNSVSLDSWVTAMIVLNAAAAAPTVFAPHRMPLGV
jgi:hypothetical protein